ncbi:hypothetical protein K435DRAFT_866931 [Dendrothele bispora CBS 962.96]|uniref:Chromatin elongation factor spt5 n=1 Tax=Dendrothele bispora (strain CBS 962.96) TaxID=1314807 RepID=A0A4S8LG57_DENBC|nr:hypothetical protein K435DRAFT_866931 [Dendrothele bispora CBS 962.96]
MAAFNADALMQDADAHTGTGSFLLPSRPHLRCPLDAYPLRWSLSLLAIMPSRNPFLDLEAYGSDDDDFREESRSIDDHEAIGAGGEDEEEREDQGELEEEEEEAGTLQLKDGEEFEDEDFPETFGPALFDSMEKRYNPEALARLKTVSPVLLPSNDDLLDKPTLHQDMIAKALLLSERKPIFWRVRCTTGKETEVVYDIMAHFHPSEHTLASRCIETFTRYQAGSKEDLEKALKEVLEVNTLPTEFQDQFDEAVAHRAQLPLVPEQNPRNLEPTGPESDNRPERAFEFLLSYAHAESMTIPEAEKGIASILEVDPIPPLWSTAIGKATLEPDADVNEAVQVLHGMKIDLVPSAASNVPLPSSLPSTPNVLRSDALTTAKDTLLSATWSNNENSYHVFSAFSVPGITGSVYLEAYLGKDPQNARVVHFLRQQPAVMKVGNVRLDRQSDKHQQRVWLQPVSPQDVADLLTMSHPSIKPLEWVRVTRGLYKNDVGLVVRRETSTGLRRLAVLLVPRLRRKMNPLPPRPPHPNHPLVRAENSASDYTSSQTIAASTAGSSANPSQHPQEEQPEVDHHPRKRKRDQEQAPQCLFDPSLWPEGDATSAWKQLGHKCYEMAGDRFEHGLLLTFFTYTAVTDIDVQMDMSTRRLFQASTHPLIQRVHMPLPENWVFLVDENVETGRIDQVEQDRCLIHFDDYDDDPYEETTLKMDVEETDVWISKTNLRKKINIGDHVEVIAGDLQGRHGFVVGNWGLEVDMVDMGSENKEPFNVAINSCRITQARNDVTIPWLNRRVTVTRGQYFNHTGIVCDVIPPRLNGPTMLDVMLVNLSHTVHIRHDDVLDTCANEPLCKAIPLLLHQQAFQQASWTLNYAPTVCRPAIDPQGRPLLPQQYFIHQHRPPVPWIDKPVMVIKGLIKNRGIVKDVELYHRFKSGMRVMVEFDFISAELGANPRQWICYGWIRDPTTGLPLHARYPLGQRDARYWRPLKPICAVSVPAPKSANQTQQPQAMTPPHRTQDFVDPFHWLLDSRLDGKSFLACWEPLDHSEAAIKDVIVTPDGQINRIWIEKSGRHGPRRWKALPQEVSLPADTPIKPPTNTRPLLVVRGDHTGKHIRQIYFKSQKGTKERLITASVFEPWGMPEEARVEEHIVVRGEDCAFVPSDPNKSRFEALMMSLRQIVRQKRQR